MTSHLPFLPTRGAELVNAGLTARLRAQQLTFTSVELAALGLAGLVTHQSFVRAGPAGAELYYRPVGSCPDDADFVPSQSLAAWLNLSSAVAVSGVSNGYSGAWTDESTFVVTVLDPLGSGLALGDTVVQARHAAGTQRPIRFRGGISDLSNETSLPLRGSFGVSGAPRIAAFVVRDVDYRYADA